ncbi:MAG: alpha/beta hydrolase [Planctomycetes bacterium GWF2_42_9]|nr:MAG: alpha/beta hydrolase [Planctomycetes bacterium GWF2_42_9]
MNSFKLLSLVVLVNLLWVFQMMASELNKSQDISFKADYDQSIERYILRLPMNFKNSMTHDLLIALHGHGSDRMQFADSNRPQCIATRDVAAERNMVFVAPDYRAKTSWMGPAAEADVIQIIKEIKTRFKIDRVFLCGGSMGGSSALTFAVLHPDMIAGVAAMNPMANHLEYDGFQDVIVKSFGGMKTEIPSEYKKRSAEYWPERINSPVGISVGGKDTVVPPQSAVRFANVLKKLGKEVCLINRPETGHDTNYEDTRQILEFVIDAAGKAPSKN